MARPKASSNLSISELESMLQSRRHELSDLSSRHASLTKQLQEVEAHMASLGGSPAKRRGRPPKGASAGPVSAPKAGGTGTRVKNTKSLVESLEEVLSASTEPMKVGDIVDGVLKSGYKTKSDNFRGIVNQTLIKERKRFGNAGRGLYVSKSK